MKIKHDAYVKSLCDIIKLDYDWLSTNVVLCSKKKGRVLAEIDVLAVKEGHLDVYEVKCSNRIIKAKKQLKRIKRLIPGVDQTFFFCGDSGLIQKINEE